MQSQFGFRWADLPSTAWELIPFSFVADWFLSIGNFIGAISPKSGVRYLNEYESVRIKRTVTRTVVAFRYGINGWVAQSAPSGAHVRILETYDRVPKVSSPGITFELDIVHALRNGRWIDTLALLTSIFGSGYTGRR